MRADEVVVGGPLALELFWDGAVLGGIRLRWKQEGEASQVKSGLGRELEAALARYVAGEEARWPDLPVDLAGLPRFHRQVLEELARIPAGKTMSYGELAAKCGCPKGARAVGQVMAKNPWPLVYPCHRVLAASGKLGGFGPGLEMKKWLLTLEEGNTAQ